MPLALHVPYSRLREIKDGKRGVSADTALRLEHSPQPDSTCRLSAILRPFFSPLYGYDRVAPNCRRYCAGRSRPVPLARIVQTDNFQRPIRRAVLEFKQARDPAP